MPVYNVGDVIEYRTFGGDIRRVRVTFKSDDIKNGLPGFDGDLVNGKGTFWGYDDQIVRVVRS